MRPRPKGAQFPTEDLEAMLLAFGDDPSPLPETVRALDDIITDYVIETCHEADAHARHAGRAKIKVDDFQFALRHDSKKLGRVQELLDMDREIKAKRKAFNVDEGKITKDTAGAPQSGKRRKNAADRNGVAAGMETNAEGGEGDVVAKEVVMVGSEADGAVGSEGVASA